MTEIIHPVRSVHFQPWIGPEYLVQSRKILVVGESHYLWTGGEADGPEFTRNRVLDYLTKGKHQFWTRATKLLTSDDAHANPALWNRVAYYVYVQTMLAKGARPTSAEWAGSADAFKAVLDQLAPARVLVLGKGLWSSISAAFNPTKVGERRWILRFEGGEAHATFVPHPRSRGFTLKDWRPITTSILA